MKTFTGWVGPINDVGPTGLPDWTAACPLWVSGTHSAGWRRQVAVPNLAVDLFGFSQASDDQLLAAAREFARRGDLMVLDSIATGSAVLVIREPQRVTVLTDLAGVWPVFYAQVGERFVYSSSASVVAGYVGSAVDERWLAARLLAGGIPAVWSEGSVYRGVAATPAGGVLLLDRGGWPAVIRRELRLGLSSFAEGSRRLGEALSSAVGARMAAHGEVSADLSGGLDSSVVAALAASARPRPALHTITVSCAELGSDDPVHARRVAAAIPGMKHIELLLPGEVDPYAALTEMPPTDEPFEDVSIFARLRWWMRAVQELGARVHLTGDGGDAVLAAPPAYLADLARHPSSGELWRHATGWARLRHRPVHRLVGAARRLARSTRAGAIERYASALEHDQTGRPHWEDLIGWPPAPACPQWFSRDARALAATALHPTGASAWNALLIGGGDVQAAARTVAQRYGRPYLQALDELWCLIQRLIDAGLVEPTR